MLKKHVKGYNNNLLATIHKSNLPKPVREKGMGIQGRYMSDCCRNVDHRIVGKTHGLLKREENGPCHEKVLIFQPFPPFSAENGVLHPPLYRSDAESKW